MTERQSPKRVMALPDSVAKAAFRHMAVRYSQERLNAIERAWARIFDRQPDEWKWVIASAVNDMQNKMQSADTKTSLEALEQAMKITDMCEREAATIH